MDPVYLTRRQVRELDRRAIDELGVPGIVLMENAGRGCVDVLERLGIDGPVVILCGKGNNAGDGFVIARHLVVRGYDCRAILLAPTDSLSGDAKTNFDALVRLRLPHIDLSHLAGDYEAFVSALDDHGTGAAWLVDAILGTGAMGSPRSPFDVAIDWMNGHPGRRLAVDMPSGLDCDSGLPAKHTVRADHTCTFVAEKIGFRAPEAQAILGQIHVLDIGVPSETGP
jgi:NAD(P)H-hydrate epimerase